MEYNIAKTIDLKNVRCPLNFVKTKLALDEIKEGDYLEAIIDEGEAMLNVPRSLKEEGHKVVNVANNNNGTFTIIVLKG